MADVAVPRSAVKARPSSMRMVVGIALAATAALVIGLQFQKATVTQSVVTVKHQVALGQVLTAADLSTKSIAAGESIPSIPAAQASSVVGKVTQAPLFAGDVLDPQAVAVNPSLPAGQLAETLALAPEQAVGGRLHAGNYVSVLAAPATSPTGAAPTASVALPAVEVLDVVQQSGASQTTSWLVTLELSPAQATQLEAVYRGGGHIDLALVGQ